MAHSILRPGFMVSLKTSVQGGVSYQRSELDASGVATATEGAAVARWETTKVVADPAEHERASKVRNEARALVSRICVATAFGLLCPATRETELFAAVAQARDLVSKHNDDATCTRVSVYVMTGKVADSDEENARAIAEEIRSLIQGMGSAIDRLEPDAIREAANKAQRISPMLAPEQSERVGAAVTAARKAARDITRRVEKGGELAAVVLADIQRGAIEQARIAFLDMDEPTAVAGEMLPAVDLGRVGSLDMDERAEASEAVAATPAPAPRSLEWNEEEPVPAPAEPEAPAVPKVSRDTSPALVPAPRHRKGKKTKTAVLAASPGSPTRGTAVDKPARRSGVRVKGAA